MAMQDMQAYSFTPGLAQRFKSSANGQLSPNASQALQILSLRLPAFLSGSPIAPDALLQPRFGGVSPDAAVRAQTSGSPSAPQPYNPPAAPNLSGGPVASAPYLGVTGPAAGSVLAPPPDVGPAPGARPGAPTIGFGGGSTTGPTGGATAPTLANLMNSLFGSPVAGGSASKQF